MEPAKNKLDSIRKTFLTGLAALIPLFVTGYVIAWLFAFIDGILGKLINKILLYYFGYEIPGLGILIFIAVIFLTGLLINVFRTQLFRQFSRLITDLPLIGKIYKPVKDVVDFIFYPPKKTFQTTVLIEYPRKGIYSVGFVTKESLPLFNEKLGKKMYNVFVPTTPSPLTGFTVLVSEDELIFVNIPVEEATKLIVSAGLLNPYD